MRALIYRLVGLDAGGCAGRVRSRASFQSKRLRQRGYRAGHEKFALRRLSRGQCGCSLPFVGIVIGKVAVFVVVAR